MADIRRAAMWMLRDKRVRRKSEPLEVFHASEFFDGAIHMSRCESIGNFARMTVGQLLADDWEIAQESSHD
jgi:hypothetical protein